MAIVGFGEIEPQFHMEIIMLNLCLLGGIQYSVFSTCYMQEVCFSSIVLPTLESPDYTAHKIAFICKSDLVHFALLFSLCKIIKKVSVVKLGSSRA